jgi:uncharacterized peroxidase-related enzyme
MRLDAVSRSELGDLETALAKTKRGLGFVPNSLLIMAQRPDLVRAFTGLSGEVFMGADLDIELLNMLAHMASSAAGCTYCQAHTATKIADDGPVSEKLRKIWEFEQSDLFTDAERAALRLARDAALVPNAVTEEHFDELKAHYTQRQIIDMVAVISLFGFLNRWNDTLATALEKEPLELAESLLTERGWRAGKHAPP